MYLMFGYETGDIIISYRLLDSSSHYVLHIGHYRIGDRNAVLELVGKCGSDLCPSFSIFGGHLDNSLVTVGFVC